MKFQTRTIHAGFSPDHATGAIATPLYQSNIYAFDGIDENKGFEYSRVSHPNARILEDNLAQLEGGRFCKAFANGTAAETSLLHLFKKGDHIICGNDVYGGTIRLFDHLKDHFNLDVSYVPMIDSRSVADVIRPNTRALWIETPSNPLLNIVDLNAMITLAKSHQLLTIVDNTMLTPCFQRPLELGADMVLHSCSKYLGGHNDVLGGAIITNDAQVDERLAFLVKSLGTVISPFDSWLILRGVKTLAIRMREHQRNAMAVAHFLSGHRTVTKVYYPGLENHPQRGLIERQMSGFGGVLSFEVAGDRERVDRILRATRLFYVAQSFGGVDSIIEHPRTMSHKSMSPEAMAAAGITEGLIRLSVGLEDPEDLIADLAQAIEA